MFTNLSTVYQMGLLSKAILWDGLVNPSIKVLAVPS
jgi:hypothetical protein